MPDTGRVRGLVASLVRRVSVKWTGDTMGNLSFAPGESDISEAHFSTSIVLFWLKADMAVTNKRFVAKQPNTLLGLIPLGYRDVAFPLTNIASAGVSIKFSLLRLIVGVILVIAGLGGLSSAAAVAIVALLLGIVVLAQTWTASLVIVNNAGGASVLRVSVFQRTSLEHFRDRISERLFADREGLRHNEVMQAHHLGLMFQQQQLLATQMQNQPPHDPHGQVHPGTYPPAPLGPPQLPGPPPAQYGPPPAQYGPPPAQYGPPPAQYGPPPAQYGPPPAQSSANGQNWEQGGGSPAAPQPPDRANPTEPLP